MATLWIEPAQDSKRHQNCPEGKRRAGCNGCQTVAQWRRRQTPYAPKGHHQTDGRAAYVGPTPSLSMMAVIKMAINPSRTKPAMLTATHTSHRQQRLTGHADRGEKSGGYQDCFLEPSLSDQNAIGMTPIMLIV